MSLMRLASLDRPSLGLSKRFSSLLPNSPATSQDDLAMNSVSLKGLPSIGEFDHDDFGTMFDTIGNTSSNTETDLPQHPTVPPPLPPELPATPKTSQIPEPHSTPVHLYHEKACSETPKALNHIDVTHVRPELAQMSYQSSVSSVPSTKRSNASSRPSRKSSMSSLAEDTSTSEKSSKESDKENALHERLIRRSRDKRVSFSNGSEVLGTHQGSRGKPGSDTRNLSRTGVLGEHAPADEIPGGKICSSPRPVSRGKRLGQAMADTRSTSAPSTPKLDFEREKISTAGISNTSATRRSSTATTLSARLSRTLTPPVVVDDIDRIRVCIMSQLHTLDDLQSCALVSKDFYRTFSKYEIHLVSSVLHRQSPAAWELRHSVRHLEKPSPFRLRSVQRDFGTVQALEDFIVWRCQSILRPQSLDALLGQSPRRKAELEEAIWMIWSFCNVFGKTSMSDATLVKQTQWLNGGSKRQSHASLTATSARSACSMKELEDMSEIWRCLEMLLSDFKGREEEARQVGLFVNAPASGSTDRELLNAWICDILSLGPKAVLTLSSCDFQQAKVLGITRWSPPAKNKTRANFLKGALEEVYREGLMRQARQKALDYRRSVQHGHKRSCSDPSYNPAHPSTRPTVPHMSYQDLRLDTRPLPQLPIEAQGTATSSTQMEIRPDCDPLSPVNGPALTSPSMKPAVFSPLSMTNKASAKLGPTLFPMQNRDQSKRRSIPLSAMSRRSLESDRASVADVIDPTDKAVALLVQEMGYSEAEAKRALAMSDSGSGIDIERAIELLSDDSRDSRLPRLPPVCELPASVGDARLARRSHQQAEEGLCEGHCKPMVLVEPRRERVVGLGVVKRGLSSRMSFRKSTRLTALPSGEERSRHNPMETGSSQTWHTTLTPATLNISATTSPIMKQNERNTTLTSIAEQSPVSPITPGIVDWPKTNNDSQQTTPGWHKESMAFGAIPAKPRVTLQRVGTGIRKSTWSIPGMKKKEQFTQPEIIGYAY